MTSLELQFHLGATLLGLGDLSSVDIRVGRINPLSQLKRILERDRSVPFTLVTLGRSQVVFFLEQKAFQKNLMFQQFKIGLLLLAAFFFL